MDASAPRLDTMMYGEPEDIWIFQVTTLNRITNPEHVHSEASALAVLRLPHKLGAFEHCSQGLGSLESLRGQVSGCAEARSSGPG